MKIIIHYVYMYVLFVKDIKTYNFYNPENKIEFKRKRIFKFSIIIIIMLINASCYR